MSRFTALARSHGVDVLIVVVALESALEVALRSELATGWRQGLTVPLAALLVLPLLWRRRFPFAAPASIWFVAVGLSYVDGRVIPAVASATVAGLVSAFLLGRLEDPVRARAGLLVVVVGAALIDLNDPTQVSVGVVFMPALFAIGWLCGFVVRLRGDEAEDAELRAQVAEREREAAARIAVAEERARIARELHDIVAHAVSVMVLQTGAVRHQLAASSAEAEALQSVEQTGRTALAEMRRLLGAMRRHDDEVTLAPQPGVDGLDALAAEVGRAGLPVRLHSDGTPYPLPHGLDVSAYRIVQEGLTNALKHSGASHVDVTLRYLPEDLHIEVRDDGPGRSTGIANGSGRGHGLVGVRERVHLYDGDMALVDDHGAGHVLRARLSLRGVRS